MVRKMQQALMTGVSYMLPFIVVAGMTIAISGICTSYFGLESDFLTNLNTFGSTVLGFVPPIMGAYVAFAIGDKAAIAPGFIGGWIANNPVLEGTQSSGFLGAIIAGLIAGYMVDQLKKMPFPELISSLKTMMVIPLVSSFVIYLLMVYPIGIVVGAFYQLIVDSLLKLSEQPGTAVILGAILSGMTAFDMGGPLSKIALTFVFAVWSDPSGLGFMVNAAIFPGIMVPPLAVGIASYIAPKKFTTAEHRQAPGTIATGLVGITEGTLPFAFRDPIRVIGSNIIGAGVGGGMMMALGISTPGVSGIIGIPPASNPLMFTLCIAVGVAISVVLMVLVKKPVTEEEIEEENVEFDIEL